MTVPTPSGSGHRVLVVDNHDSFTFSLARLFEVAGATVDVLREDVVPTRWPSPFPYSLIVLSPGPGRPEDHPVDLALLRALPCPIFGVCLGLQAMGLVAGATVRRGRPIHGWTSAILHDGTGCFEGLPSPFRAIRYNSLLVDPDSVPAELEVTAWTRRGEVMGLRHRERPIEAVQFHPESVRSQHGAAMIHNVLRRTPRLSERPLRSPA